MIDFDPKTPTIVHINTSANRALFEISRQNSLAAYGRFTPDIMDDRSFVQSAMVKILKKSDLSQEEVTGDLLYKINDLVDKVRKINNIACYDIGSELDFIQETIDEMLVDLKEKERPQASQITTVMNKYWKPWAAVLAAGAVGLSGIAYRNHLIKEEAGKPLTPLEDATMKGWMQHHKEQKAQQAKTPEEGKAR